MARAAAFFLPHAIREFLFIDKKKIRKLTGNKKKKRFAIVRLSCTGARINPEIMKRTSDGHYFVRNAGFSGSQNVRANA